MQNSLYRGRCLSVSHEGLVAEGGFASWVVMRATDGRTYHEREEVSVTFSESHDAGKDVPQ